MRCRYKKKRVSEYCFMYLKTVTMSYCICLCRMLTDQLSYSVVNKMNLCTRYLRCWNITFRFETNIELTTTRGGEDTGKSLLRRSITQSRDPMWPPESMLSRRPVDWIGYVFSSELSFGLKEISDCGWKFKGQLKTLTRDVGFFKTWTWFVSVIFMIFDNGL